MSAFFLEVDERVWRLIWTRKRDGRWDSVESMLTFSNILAIAANQMYVNWVDAVEFSFQGLIVIEFSKRAFSTS